MTTKAKQQIELLKQILATADLSSLPESLRDRASEAIADIGGCAFCGRAATRLCDYHLGSEIDKTHTKWPAFLADGEMFTCDAPLCEQCCAEVGMTTVSGIPEVIDYCPFHAGKPVDRAQPVTIHEAERLRIEAWKRTVFA